MKIAFLALFLFIQLFYVSAQQKYQLLIKELEVSSKKSNGKSWDTWKGKPDLIVRIYIRSQNGQWKKEFASSVFEDRFQIKDLETSVFVQDREELKIEVLDKDVSSNDEIGCYTWEITFSEISSQTKNSHQFDLVHSFVYFFKQSEEQPTEEKEPRDEILELKNPLQPESAPIKLPLRLIASEKKVQVRQKMLLKLPMEYITFSTADSIGEFLEFPEKKAQNPTIIKTILKLSNKVSKTLSDKAEFLHEFVNHIPCIHPETSEQIPFKEFLRYYIHHNGYVEKGYFKGSELAQDPVNVLLRLLLFDKWILYEAKMIRGNNGNWYSLEDCIKGLFKNHYSHLALDSLKNALKFSDQAKSFSRLQLFEKLNAFKNLLTCYLNTCLYLVEANRSFLTQYPLTNKAFEKIRELSLQGKLFIRFREPLKIEVVQAF